VLIYESKDDINNETKVLAALICAVQDYDFFKEVPANPGTDLN
jgi:hypothetical protein